MNIQSIAPETITSLTTSGILVHVKICLWAATTADQEISDEVTTSKNADRDSGRFVKYLMATCEEHRALVNDGASWRNWIKRNCFPWAGTWYYLPNLRIAKFMKEYEERQAHTQALLDRLIEVYPTVVSNTAFQGDMFKPEDYPSIDEVRNKFSVSLFTQEVPTGDFRNQIVIESANQVREHFDKQLPKLINALMDKQINTMTKLLTSISSCCTTDTVVENGKVKVKKGRIYESTLQSALEMCDTYKEFNITDDPRIESARAELENLLKDVSIEVLRESDSVRAKVKSGVDDILAKFQK